MDRREIIDLLKKYLQLLHSEGISVSKAYLFGSYSNGTQREDSDIDILIVSNNHDENDDAIIGKVWRLTRKVNSKIEPLFIGVKKFGNNNSSLLIDMIKLKGIEIV